MNFSEITGFSKSRLKPTDTVVTSSTGEIHRETRDADGHVTKTLIGKYELENKEVGVIEAGKLLLASQHVAHDLDLLQEHGVTHIVNVTTDVTNKYPDHVTYLNISVPDVADTRITDTFPEAFAFIDGAIQDGGCVLVHCNQGVSRSASIVIGYMMKWKGLSYQEAFDHVKSKRSAIHPNYGFRKQLEDYKP